MTDTERLAHAARELLRAASEPVLFADSPGSDPLALVPATYLDFLRTALGPEQARCADRGDCFRGTHGEHIEVGYLHIPGLPSDEIDEIVCGPMHLESLGVGNAYLRVAGLMVRIQALSQGRLSITCEPDDCTPITHEATP